MAGTLRIWAWEIAAMTSSIACLMAIVVILFVYNNHEVFTLFNGITLNAIISLLSTLSKTTLLFVLGSTIGQQKWILFSRRSRPLIDAYIIDEASRGPLGSLWAMWRMKGSLLTTIGALCTVLSLAIDPFTQQLIQYQQVPVNSTVSRVTVPRAQRFSRGIGDVRSAAFEGGGNLTQKLDDYARRNQSTAALSQWNYVAADPGLQSAAYYGLTQTKTAIMQQLQTTCTSGNCTFTPYDSLAICNRCVDISNEMVMSGDTQTTSLYISRGNAAVFIANSTRITLPNGLNVANMNGPKGYGPAHMVSYGTGNTSETVSFQDADTLVWSMTMIRAQNNTQGLFDWPNVPMTALECGLYYCVNEYTTLVTNGSVTETIVTKPDAKRIEDSWQPINTTSWNWTGPAPTSLEYNLVWSNIPRTDLSLGDGYNVSQTAVNSISNFFQNFMTRPDLIAEPEFPNPVNGYVFEFEDYTEAAPMSMQTLMMTDNIPELFDNIALSMSNAIRAGGDNSTTHEGIVVIFETRFQIQWPWISLHIILALLGIFDLVLTTFATSREDALPWKSHFLAAMAWGQLESNLMSKMHTTKEMEDVAWDQKAGLYGAMPDDATPLQRNVSQFPRISRPIPRGPTLTYAW